MNWFKNLKTGSKLFVGFGMTILLLGVTIVVAYSVINRLSESQQGLYNHEFAGVMDILELRTDLNRQKARMLEMTQKAARVEQEATAQDIASRAREIDRGLQNLTANYKDDANIQSKLTDLKSTLAIYREARASHFKAIYDGKYEEIRQAAEAQQNERFDKMVTLAVELTEALENQAKDKIKVSAALAGQSIGTILIIGSVAFVLSLVVSIALSRMISRPLAEISLVARRMASGDLTGSISDDDRADEVGELAKNFRRMSENLREQLRGMGEGAGVLGAAAGEIVASTTQLASSASEAATAVSETTTTVEEVRQTAQMASQKAKAVSDTAQTAAQISQNGRKSSEEAMAGMNRIRQQMEAIAGSMVRLSEQGQAIGQIIATVEDLSSQSNLLAVNAAIEAAKAGEHGRGFGVVAQEVKSLAEQSRQATGQVRTILGDIQKATTAAVMATEQGSKAVEAGGKQTEAAGAAIQALTGSVTDAANTATQIAASSQQQLVGMEQVAMAMENIKQASTQNVSSARQLEAAARGLNELGQRLKQLIEPYKV